MLDLCFFLPNYTRKVVLMGLIGNKMGTFGTMMLSEALKCNRSLISLEINSIFIEKS